MNAFVDVLTQKPSWAVASLLSAIYGAAFVRVSTGTPKADDLLFGFCVWGTPEDPSVERGCEHSRINSHNASFAVDAIMAALAGALYWRDASDEKKGWMYAAAAFVISMHGMLHWFLQQTSVHQLWGVDIVVDCYIDLDGLDPGARDQFYQVGYYLFGTFAFLLSLAILAFGLGGVTPRTGIFSAVVAAMVVGITKDAGGDLLLPGLFVVVHPLACLTGLVSSEPAFHPTVAKWFGVCTFVGILELLACADVLRPLGGHMWYDLALHAAVLAALPCFWPPGAKGEWDRRTD